MNIRYFAYLIGFAICLGFSFPTLAEPNSEYSELNVRFKELQDTVSKLESVIKLQQDQIEELKTKKEQKNEIPETKPAGSETGFQVASNNLSGFNPEIGVVTDIVAKLTESDEDSHGNDRISARHVEFVFGHDIDPYSRLDVTYTLSDLEDPHLEEAYITHWGLPYDTKVRLGRFYPRIGKYAGLHLDQLDTVDQALVVEDLFGHEGYSRSAVELSNFIPVPWNSVTHEVSLGVAEGGVGHGGKVFGDTRRRPTFFSHVRNFWDVSDMSTFELSGSYLLGSGDEDSSYEVDLFGLHSTYVHHFNGVNRLKLQAEAYFQDRSEAYAASDTDHDHSHLSNIFKNEEDDHDHEEDHEDGHHEEDEHEDHDDDHEMHEDGLESFKDNPFGFYTLADYRLSPSWGLGFRYDYLEPLGLDHDATRSYDSAYTGYLSFYQSEFARWRVQYQHYDPALGEADNRFFLQGTFAIGVHKHQLQ